MEFDQARTAALALLQAHGRAKNSEIQAALGGDRSLLDQVREDLIFNDLAKDKDGVGLVYLGPAAVPPEEPAGKRAALFISYGRRDARELVDRLERDLKEAGFDVWRDTREIRPGVEWQQAITDGLRSAQVVVAVMTPHSVRTARDADSADQTDSVCLGEIAYALFHPPPRPVVPVMAQTCEPPLAIFHLDYVDMRRWQDSDDQYRAGLQRLIDGVHAAVRGEKRYRRWHHELQPFDFAAFLFSRRGDFAGRQWLFDRIDAWRTSPGRERALLIKGDPGVGKSAIVAELVHRNPDGQVLAYHCCQWDHGETLRPARFVRSLAAMIAGKVEGFAHQLQHDAAIQEILSESRCEADPASALEEGLLAPLEKLAASDGDPRYILIDALDEALLVPAGSRTIVDLLATRLPRLPAWLRLVATTRKDPQVLARLGGLRAEEIDTQSAENLADLREFLDLRFASPDLAGCLAHARLDPHAVREKLVAKSAGNFLYVRQMLDAWETGLLDPQRLDQLPPGLAGLYENRFLHEFPSEAAFAAAKRLFEVLVAAQEPLTEEQLSAATELQPAEQVPLLLKRLAVYLPARPGEDGVPRYAFFHRSLPDWLVHPERRGLLHSVSLPAGHRRLAAAGWREYERDVQSMRPYALTHLPTHLIGAAFWDDLVRLLIDLPYWEARSGAGQTFSLAKDLTQAWQAMPDRHPQRRLLQLLGEALRRDIHFIARHAGDYPQGLFQCLWNNGWWYDGREAAGHYLAAEEGRAAEHAPWQAPAEAQFQQLLERWRKTKEQASGVFCWLRSRRPPTMHLGTAQQAVLRGHEHRVTSVALSGDSRRVASGSFDRTVRVWDIPSSAELLVLRGHDRWVRCVAFRNDGQWIASGADDRTVRVWDAHSGATLAILRGHKSWVNSVTFSPDGRCLASGSEDRTVRLWDPLTAAELAVLRGHAGAVKSVAFSGDGRRMVSGGADGAVRLWDVLTGNELAVYTGHQDLVTSVSFSADSQRIASGSQDQTVRVWDVEDPRQSLVLPAHSGKVTSVAFDADTGRILAASSGNTVRIWETDTGLELPSLRGHEQEVTSLAASSQGLLVVTGAADRTVRVWEPRGAVDLTALRGHAGRVLSMTFNRDGSRLVTSSIDQSVRVWDAQTGAELAVLRGHEGWVRSVQFSMDGRRIVSASEDRTVRVWDAQSGAELAVLRMLNPRVTSASFDEEGRRIIGWYRGKRYRGKMRCVWDAETYEPVDVAECSIDAVPAPAETAARPYRALAGSFETAIEDAVTGRSIAWFPARLAEIAAHPDGRTWAGAVANHVCIITLEGRCP